MIYRIIGIVTAAHVVAAAAIAVAARLAFPGHAPGIGTWLGLFLAVDAVVLYAMLERRAPVFGAITHHGRRDRPEIALSFDDGPNEPHTARVLDVLQQHGVVATFFLIGDNVERHPGLARRIVSEGHEVGNHTADHRVLPLCGPDHIRRAIRRASDAIEQATGVRPRLFRAPHGWRNPWVDRVARSEGCEPVAWSLGVFDTSRPGAAVIRSRVARGLRNGCIVLLHDGRGTAPGADASQLVEALPGIIADAKARAFRFVTVGDMLAGSRSR